MLVLTAGLPQISCSSAAVLSLFFSLLDSDSLTRLTRFYAAAPDLGQVPASGSLQLRGSALSFSHPDPDSLAHLTRFYAAAPDLGQGRLRASCSSAAVLSLSFSHPDPDSLAHLTRFYAAAPDLGQGRLPGLLQLRGSALSFLQPP